MAYEVTLSNGEAVILKVAPAKGVRIMTSEKNIMFAEVLAMEKAMEHGGIPVPKVLGHDDSHTICKSSYFFMEKLNGSSLNEIKSSLTQEQIDAIYMETGRICRRLTESAAPVSVIRGSRNSRVQTGIWSFVGCWRQGSVMPDKGTLT